MKKKKDTRAAAILAKGLTPPCPNHGQRISVEAGLDVSGFRIRYANVSCWDCGQTVDGVSAASVTLNTYEDGVYVSRRIGDVKRT